MGLWRARISEAGFSFETATRRGGCFVGDDDDDDDEAEMRLRTAVRLDRRVAERVGEGRFISSGILSFLVFVCRC